MMTFLKNLLCCMVLGWVVVSCKTDNEPAPEIDCDQSGLELELTPTAVSECGATDGEIAVAVSGGEGNITLSLNGGSFQNTSGFTGLQAGTYSVIAQDINGCTVSSFATVGINGSQVSIDEVTTQNAGCGQSQGVITVQGTGSGDLQYRLDNGAFQSSSQFTDLSAGNYDVTIQDASGCSTSARAVVLNGTSYADEVSSIINTSCIRSGCHDGSQGASLNWSSFENVQNRASAIKSQTQSGNMPPEGETISDQEIATIACWVDDGAPNN
ncbi:hypothetical protein LVD15_22555 [Fulvivirga maritima]|uniref:hypothetical protein n=1 Tax=Fulvivirga maritima TaxID=2904247 RepID=UPI001F4737DD|nr:hypothetical protein [Fulvivirga maritima]UII26057.1 hypothetical protein LVD15_22555 [Fulvivirga maritima]